MKPGKVVLISNRTDIENPYREGYIYMYMELYAKFLTSHFKWSLLLYIEIPCVR